MSTFDTKQSTGPEAGDASSPKAAADAKVGSALAERGQGEAHASGAVFHDNAVSHAAADAVGARAFTAGNDVYFGAGQHDPGSQAGGALIQHELAHVQQTRGVAAPEPGNFAVSSPDSAAEAGARDGSGSGAASPNTIYRDPTPGGTPSTTGTGPAGGGTGTGTTTTGSGTGTGTGTAPDPYEDWKASVNRYNRPDAVSKWATLASEAKAKFNTEDNSFKFRVIFVMKKDSVKVFKDGGADIIADNNSYSIFLADDFPEWLPELRAAAFLDPFLAAEPLTTHVDQGKARKLKTWIDQSTAIPEAKAIFHKVYPTLHDSSPATWGTAQAWPLNRIQQLFGVLCEYLSSGHVSTVTGGFVYVTGAGFGWWNSGSKRVWLPDSANGMGHSMSGGSGRGISTTDTPGGARTGRSVSPAYTDSKGVGQPAGIGHMVGTILHEAGHGVGDQLDGGRGNAYAEDPSKFPGFNKISLNDVADALWVSGTTATGTEPAVASNAKLDESHAKDFFKTEIANGQGTYSPGWVSNPSRADMATYCKWRYASVPLQKMWDFFVERGHAKDSSYAWDDESARIPPGSSWVYGYLTRGGMEWTKYKKAAWDQKVSWYSLSSPREWFAEQYTHFYRTDKTGSGMDPDTVTLLKDLDKQEFVPTSGGDGVTIPNPNPGAGGGGSLGDAPGGTTAGTSPNAPAQGGGGEAGSAGAAGGSGPRPAGPTPDGPDKPLFFPWD